MWAYCSGVKLVSSLLLVGLIAGCSRAPTQTVSPGGKIRVTTTVTMVGDLVHQVGGDRVTVQALMGPGVDPHLYKATAAQ